MNELVLMIITYYIIAILCIIIVLNLIQYYTKNKYKKEVSNYDIEKNELIDAPIMTELKKAEELSRNKAIKDKYNVWKSEIDSMKDNLEKEINDMIIDADFLLDQKDYKNYTLKRINLEIKLLEAKGLKNKIYDEIREITLCEENNRAKITLLKERFREAIRIYNTSKNTYVPIDKTIDLQIETIEKRFQEFEILMEKQDYVSVNKLVSALETLIKHFETIIDEVPPIVAMALTLIPKRLVEMKSTYENMVRRGFQLDYLNIEYNIEEINKKLNVAMSKVRVLNLEDVLFELRTILEYTDSVFNDFEKEKIARKEYEDSVTLFKSKVKKINDIMNKLYGKVVDAKYNYKLGDDKIKELDILSSELGILDEDFSNLYNATKTVSFPYTRLNKELELLVIKLSKIEEKIDVYMQSIGTMQEDEKRAREQLNDMNTLLDEAKNKIREYKLPIVPDYYFVQLKEAIEAVREVNKELDKKPINIDILNTRVDTARDLVFKLNNTSNEIIKTAMLAETAIVYGNRFRCKKQYVDEGLNKSEMLFIKGEYRKSLELTLNTMDLVEPGIYKKLLNYYEKNSK